MIFTGVGFPVRLAEICVNDDSVIVLLTEIRDLQRQQLDMARQTLANQQQAIANQAQALANQQASAQRAVDSQTRFADMWDHFRKQQAQPWWKRFLFWFLIILAGLVLLEMIPDILIHLVPGNRS